MSDSASGAGTTMSDAQFRVFVRSARDACREALFYLGLLTPTKHAKTNEELLDDYASFAAVELDALMSSVPPVHPTGGSDWRARVIDAWNALRPRFDGRPIPLDSVEKLRDAVEAFLEVSKQTRFFDSIEYHVLPRLFRMERRLVLTVGSIATVALVALGVEAIRNLLWNEGWFVIIPSAGILFAFGIIGLFLFRHRRWRVGADAFWNWSSRPPRRGLARWPDSMKMSNHLVHQILFTLALYVASGVVFWQILLYLESHELTQPTLGQTSVTIFLFLALASFYILLAHFVDVWDYFDERPIRLICLFLGILFLAAALVFALVREVAIAILVLLIGVTAVLVLRSHRDLKRWALLGVEIAAVGLILVGIDTRNEDVWSDDGSGEFRLGETEWPLPSPENAPVVVVAASGGGSRAAIYTALTLERLHQDYPEITENLQAISSVSGGSLANAAYVAHRYNHPYEPIEPGTLVPYVDRDFLRPTLAGALLPWRTRGQSVERAWKAGSGLGELTLAELARRWEKARAAGDTTPPFPLPLFNACTIDGHAVVLSPLSEDHYLWGDVHANDPPFPSHLDGDRVTWVYHRDAVYPLEQLIEFDPSLAASVRASANFPFGFPLVRMRTSRPLKYSPVAEARGDGEKMVWLTDGGVLSNSGMWSLFGLLMRRADALKQRGVLLIIVEASGMPTHREDRRSVTSLYGAIADKNPFGQAVHRRMLELLAREYGSKLAVAQIELTPFESSNVLTTWALDQRTFDLLGEIFETQWSAFAIGEPGSESSLGDKWRSIQEPWKEKARYVPSTSRPPLS